MADPLLLATVTDDAAESGPDRVIANVARVPPELPSVTVTSSTDR